MKPLRPILLACLLFTFHAPAAVPASTFDTSQIERLTGAKGKLNGEGDVFKVSLPRDDLGLTVNGVRISPPLGTTSWAAFTKAANGDMVMADVVVTEQSANKALDAALGQGLAVTGLHNHFLGDTPRIMFMHLSGMGDEAQLARAVGAVFAASRERAGGEREPRVDTSAGRLDGKALDGILGEHGEMDQGVYKVTVGRTTSMGGQTVGKDLGVNTWAAFAGSDTAAVVDGDFAMHENELQPVLKALRRAGIRIAAIHNHMVGETPRIVFLHYWGAGRAVDLAKGVRAALDVTRTK